MFHKKTVKSISVKNKTVLLRADYNVPIVNGRIHDNFRIRQSIQTVKYLVDNGAKLVIISHLGRPKGPNSQESSLKPVAEELKKQIGKDIMFSGDSIGQETKAKIAKLKPGEILLLENLRFHPGEEANDEEFARQLAEGFDIFVQDGFGVVHRAHASTDAITRFLPSVSGILLEKEFVAIKTVIEDPIHPLMALIGGAKISDKIDILERFMDIADIVAVGGAMSNTFLLAEGVEIGKSLADPDDLPLAKQILSKARDKAKSDDFVLYVPQDGVVSTELDSRAKTRIVDWGTHVIADVENYPQKPAKKDSIVGEDEKILDIGPFSGAFIAGSMQLAKTVIWNGAMGVTEVDALQHATGPFSHGTELVVEAILGQFGHKPYSVVGGGDTVGYIESRGLVDNFDHVSTGGGASIELMSGKKLPGIESLMDK
jgi:phosphoglycerate kinase